MKAIHKKRLLKLAEHLEKGKLIHKVFDFATFNSEKKEPIPGWDYHKYIEAKPYKCGTLGCALGEMPAVDKKKWNFDKTANPHLKGTRKSAWDSAEEYFGISDTAVEHLFSPHSQDTDEYGGVLLGDDATAKQVASNIRKFVKKMESARG